MTNISTLNQIENKLTERKDRSAWSNGVTLYAIELLQEVRERTGYEGHAPQDVRELVDYMLNGASDWSQYSWGGCSLIYDEDIAKRLCCPSELKKTRNGERRPNAREEWLDTQARALNQAASLIKAYFRVLTA